MFDKLTRCKILQKNVDDDMQEDTMQNEEEDPCMEADGKIALDLAVLNEVIFMRKCFGIASVIINKKR